MDALSNVASPGARRWRRIAWIVYGIAVVVGVFAPHAASAGLLDSVTNDFISAINPMYGRAATWSVNIFYGITVLELTWALVEGELFHSASIETWLKAFVFRLIIYGFGWYLVTNQVSIAQWANTEIATITGAFSPAGVQTADQIVNLGWTNAVQLFNMDTDSWNPVVVASMTLIQFGVAFLVQIAFLLVGVEDVFFTIGAQLCIALGSVLLGFVGTRWTRWIAGKWPNMVLSTFLLIVAVHVVASIGNTISGDIATRIVNTNSAGEGGAIGSMSVIAVDAAVFLLLAIGLPTLAGFLGATTPVTGGATMRSAAMTAASFVGARIGSGGGGSGAPAGSNGVAKVEAATRLR